MITSQLVTPAGNSVNSKIDPVTALKRAAEILREPELPSFNNGSEALYSALCASGASAGVRFHALAALRLEALGSPEAGDLSRIVNGMMPYEVAELLERAAVMAGVT